MDCPKIDKTLGIGNWTKRAPSRNKEAIIREICAITKVKSLDIALLPIKDIEEILSSIPRIDKPAVPENSRFKAPYVLAILGVLPNLKNLTKLSISSLKEIIGVINTCAALS